METRALKEQRLVSKGTQVAPGVFELDPNGIYIAFHPSDVTKAAIMIIGPDDTPYKYGCLIFDYTFTDLYPASPPKVIFRSETSLLRIHPNIYAEGKLCLSVLGTWSVGDGWSPAMNITSVARLTRSLLMENALRNEPGYDQFNSNWPLDKSVYKFFDDAARIGSVFTTAMVIQEKENMPSHINALKMFARAYIAPKRDEILSYLASVETPVRTSVISYTSVENLNVLRATAVKALGSI